MILGVGSNLKASPADAASIASNIKYHAEFTPLFSPENFAPSKAFFATAQSVRDALIVNWNATYDHCEKMNVKQAYYLSMEFLQVQLTTACLYSTKRSTKNLYAIGNVFIAICDILQGRALLNAIGNLELTGEYAEALQKLGHTLETVASQVSTLSTF